MENINPNQINTEKEINEPNNEKDVQTIKGLAVKHAVAFLEEAFEKGLIDDSEEVRDAVTLVMANLAGMLLEQGGDVSDLDKYAYTMHPFLEENIKKVIHLATHDHLTDALNRFGLEWFIASNDEDPVALLAIDLDRFKKVNDEYGHNQGDIVLKEVNEVMQESLRDGDKVARTGGDEFTAVLCDNETDPTDGKRDDKKTPDEVIEGTIARIKQNLDNYLSLPGNAYLKKVGFYISVGGKVWEQDKSYEYLLHAADMEMMNKKKERQAQNGGSYR